MKKTLITLVAMAGVAAADVCGDWEAVFATANKTTAQTYTDYSATFAQDSPLSLEFTGLATTHTTGNAGTYADDKTLGSVQTGALRPNVNVAASSSNNYVLTFKLTNDTSEKIEISQITFDSFLYNAGGNAHSSGAAVDIVYTLTTTGKTPVTLASNTISYSANAAAANDNAAVLSLGTNSIELAAGAYTELSLKVSKGTNGNGSFVGLSGATFKVVPEPATATLSLLALCGLAARRRRH